MSEVKWTNEQLQAIEEKGQNILVSAAAGSGKTAVLVERMINKIVNQGVDIDKILIVTFTSAAASEMRERILEAIYKKLETEPDNKNLQKQIVLLNRANISTIHAFCLNIIKNNFFEIGISPDFRIAETAEVELLKLEVLDDLLEELYEENNAKINKITEVYSGYRGDENLKALILDIYNYIQSTPFPEEWLKIQTEKFSMKDKTFSETEWSKIILENYKENITSYIEQIEKMSKQIENDIDLQKYYLVLRDDIEQLNSLIADLSNWDEIVENSQKFSMKNWPRDKKIISELADNIHAERNTIRDEVKGLIKNAFCATADQAREEIQEMHQILILLQELIIEFTEKFKQAKQSKNIIDFNDIEHYALNILTTRNEDGSIVQSEIAKKYMEKFTEIAIDEYQDSNFVQESILSSISNGKNLFMVGDVKQSIYKFRQAQPELFLDKYEKYKLKDELEEGDSLKIQLFNNFRSKEKVLDFVNRIFANIMSKKLGDIDYTQEEYLNYSANYEEIEQNDKLELHIIEKRKDEEKEEEDGDEVVEELDTTTLEAKFVARKIKEILQSDLKVWDKKQKKYRAVTYKDIVVLLRSPNSVASTYEKEIAELSIPVFSDTNVKYLESIEIETIMNLLRIIDNPMQDIPLVAVLRSYIGGFTDNELIEIRLNDKKCPFHEALMKADNPKIDKFMEQLKKWRFEQEYLPLDELIWRIYLDTGYFNYVSLMPNGEFRQANLKMLFEQAKQYENASFKGLFNFIRFIENLKKNSGDLSSAKLIGENDNVVRIMSIHKSKGLEFPVVFLCGTGKKFNLNDLSNEILLHQDLGFGPNYIDYNKKVKYDTLAKEALKVKLRNENISEEMRVLYVALTRSKEKLIVTGVSKKEPANLKKCESYLDWIRYVNSKVDMSDILETTYYNKSDLEREFGIKEEKESSKITDVIDAKIIEKEDLEKIEKELNWKYANLENTRIESKTSVSSISKKDATKEVSFEVPEFMKDEVRVSKAEIGTMTHELLQKLDFNKAYSVEELKEMNEYVNANEIYTFLQSNLASRIRKANQVLKEQPFYTYIKAKEIYEVESEEPILVQGIIDLYFIEDNDIVLVDYKTDNVNDAKILVDRYAKQLSLYKKALEEATGKKVKEVYIYSTKLNTEILL